MVTRVKAKDAAPSAKSQSGTTHVLQDDVTHAVAGALGLYGERMSKVDTAWLRMDRPSNLMQIVGVMLFDGELDYERLQRSIERRMLSCRRFRQIARQDAGFMRKSFADVPRVFHVPGVLLQLRRI